MLIAGDTHGQFNHVKHKIDMAKRVGDIARIVILGDFGLWWGHEAIVYIDAINEYAKANNVQVFALPGNHENYKWWNSVIESAPATSHGWAYLRSHVLLSPRVQHFRWAGKNFVVAGGAVSIDKSYRLVYERETGKRCFSPDEQLTDSEVEVTRKIGNNLKIDYLFTHDCSNRTPFYARLKPDIDSEFHRKKIDRVLMNTNPRFHFHGHMHTKYDWMNFVGEKNGEAVYVQTYGLEEDIALFSWGVLDLSNDEFTWGPFALLPEKKGEPVRVEIDDNF